MWTLICARFLRQLMSISVKHSVMLLTGVNGIILTTMEWFRHHIALEKTQLVQRTEPDAHAHKTAIASIQR
jgi:hypothetical protein